MRFRVLVLALASLAAFPACAVAAMVSPKSGEVRVGTGQGFQRILAPTEVTAGAQVMVGPNGAALIAYSENCVVPAPAAAVTIVESRPPCESLPEPSYFGFAQSNEEGIGIKGDLLAFTPKVDAPEKAEAPAPVIVTKKKPERAVERRAESDERLHDHHSLLIVGGVALGAGALAALLASPGGDQPAAMGGSDVLGAVLASQGGDQPASP